MREVPVGLPPQIGVAAERWDPIDTTVRRPRSLRGDAQVVGTPDPVWAATVTFTAHFRDRGIWAGWFSRHRGGVVAARLGPVVDRFPTYGALGARAWFADATGFTDGTGHVAGGGRARVLEAAREGETVLIVGAHELGARAAQLGDLSIRGRLHRVEAAERVSEHVARVEVWPPLPCDVPAQTRLDRAPYAFMVVDGADGAGPEQVARNTRLRWTLSWTEAPPEGPLWAAPEALPEVAR